VDVDVDIDSVLLLLYFRRAFDNDDAVAVGKEEGWTILT